MQNYTEQVFLWLSLSLLSIDKTHEATHVPSRENRPGPLFLQSFIICSQLSAVNSRVKAGAAVNVACP